VYRVQEFISAENLFEFPEKKEKTKKTLKRPAAESTEQLAPPSKKANADLATTDAIILISKLLEIHEEICTKLMECKSKVISDELMTRINTFNGTLAIATNLPKWDSALATVPRELRSDVRELKPFVFG